jgi:hypothetical protein
MDDSVIIGGDYDCSRTVVLNKLILNKQLVHQDLRTLSFRSKDNRPDIQDEVVIKTDSVDRNLLKQGIRLSPNVIAFDTGFDELFDKDFPAFFPGHTVFYSVPAFGDSAEEIKDNAIGNFFKFSGYDNEMYGFEKIMYSFEKVIVTKLNDLNNENSFTVTEFLFNNEVVNV